MIMTNQQFAEKLMTALWAKQAKISAWDITYLHAFNAAANCIVSTIRTVCEEGKDNE